MKPKVVFKDYHPNQVLLLPPTLREQILEELEKAHIYIEQLNNRIKVIESQNEIIKENQMLNERIEKLEELVTQLMEK